ncbi:MULTISPECIES: hypothetical protein, partial [unclassified Streptomyces]|uniref:hypothetical protein n=1 Tax=unclassified Streptomyces TaxID=2593676 RepID=UPI00114CCCF4
MTLPPSEGDSSVIPATEAVSASAGDLPAAPLPGPRPAPARRRIPPRVILVPAVLIGVLAGGGNLRVGGSQGIPLFFLGLVVGTNLSLLITRLLARPAGLAAVWSSVGVGRRLGSTVRGGRLWTFRSLPLILLYTCLVVTDRPGLRRRLWRTTALAVLVELALAAALIASGGAARPLGWGAAAWTALYCLPRRHAAFSRGWVLFRLPFGDHESGFAEWVHDPAALAAARALAAGRVATMRAALGAAEPSPRPQRRAMEAALALAEGRYDDAAREAYALQAQAGARQLRLAACQLYASALAHGVEARHWAPEAALPQFRATMAAMRTEHPTVHRFNGLGAL